MRSHVLYVCTGNICRSPFAELLSRRLVEDLPRRHVVRDWIFTSAGIAGWEGHPMDAVMAAELRARGGSPEGFTARRLTRTIAFEADVLLVMDQYQLDYIVEEWPQLARRTWLLSHAGRVASETEGRDLLPTLRHRTAPGLATDEVADPYRRGEQAAAATAARIELAVRPILGA